MTLTTPRSNQIHSKLRNITLGATKVHVILRSVEVLTRVCDTIKHVTIWNLSSLSPHLRWCGPLHLTFLGNVAYACTNIQQMA